MSIRISDKNNIPKALKGLAGVKGKKIESGVFGEGEMAMIAGVHEFGADITVTPKMRAYLHHVGIHLKPETTTIKIPERSYLRSAHDEHSDEVVDKFEQLLPNVIDGVDGKAVLDGLGMEMKGKIQQKIVSVNSPALSSLTIERKGSSSPLVDGGNLLGSIDYRVT